jgi:5-formyltetrahydrofolate cyclo-ligase
MPEQVSGDKAHIREQARAARARLSGSERRNGSARAARTVLRLYDLDHLDTIAAYIATPEELDPFLIIDALRFRGLHVALPRVRDPLDISMHLVIDDSQLVAGSFGILEPAAAAPIVDPEDIDAILVPGVAFDVTGNRLGHGGGYYDRLLPRLRGDALRIGLAFDEQVFEEIPVEEHDAPLDAVVTPTQVYRREPPQASP